MGKPRIVIVAGPNGAGKTTFARQYLARPGIVPDFVNADFIAEGLDLIGESSSGWAAGRQMLAEIERRVDRRMSFAMESTLSGRTLLGRIRGWQLAGCAVSVFYLRLESPDLAVQRVRQRVAEGGHSVPEAVIRRRFRRSWKNFRERTRPVVDSWALYDNSGPLPRLVAEGRRRRRRTGAR